MNINANYCREDIFLKTYGPSDIKNYGEICKNTKKLMKIAYIAIEVTGKNKSSELSLRELKIFELHLVT